MFPDCEDPVSRSLKWLPAKQAFSGRVGLEMRGSIAWSSE